MSNYDTLQINMTLLKQNKSIFEQRKRNFVNNTYSTFKSSYINSCSDNYIRQMKKELDDLYLKIEKGYSSIDKWWTEYNNEVE